MAGGIAFPLFEETETTVPPEGEIPLSWTVAVDGDPPEMVAGETESPVTQGGLIVSFVVADIPSAVAVIVATTGEVTGTVETEKVVAVAP